MAQKQRAKPPQGKKVCINCHKDKSLINYYQVSNPLTSSDGKTVNVCKRCVKKESINSGGSLNIEKFKNMLMLMDKAFAPSVIDSAIAETKLANDTGKGRKDLIGNYIKNLNLSQYAKLSFIQSLEMIEQGTTHISNSVTTSELKQRDKEDVYVRQVDNFIVTNDIIDLFGEGYTKTEYRLMQEKFEKIKINYTMQTNLHEEALATYVRFKVKEERATASGNVGEAEKWNKAAQDAADKAKLTPKQLTKADLQRGINSFSEISQAVEQAVDIISILPRFKYSPNDAPDFIIWCYINYTRKLKGLPECEYEDVYRFYDDKKDEYIAQYGDPYGIFENDTTEANRKNVEKFITLPKDY